MCVPPSLYLSVLLCDLLQVVWPVLSRLPGRLRRVERGGGVHVSGAAPHRSVQPAGAVPLPGLPLTVASLHAAGHQHRGCVRQVKLFQKPLENGKHPPGNNPLQGSDYTISTQ